MLEPSSAHTPAVAARANTGCSQVNRPLPSDSYGRNGHQSTWRPDLALLPTIRF